MHDKATAGADFLVSSSLQLQEASAYDEECLGTRAEEHVLEPMHKVSRATTAMAEALEDGIHAVKRVGKTGSDAAEEFIEDAKDRVKRHPAGTIAAAFAVGVAIGGLLDALIRRK